MEKVPSSVWKTDPGRKKFLARSEQELNNSKKKFRDRSVQIRVEERIYNMLKYHARSDKKTIVKTVSKLLESTYAKYTRIIKESITKITKGNLLE